MNTPNYSGTMAATLCPFLENEEIYEVEIPTKLLETP